MNQKNGHIKKRPVDFNNLLHGGDYNPEQWLHRPDILAQDIEYMKAAKVNTVSLGIFSWAVLEPKEGEYNFQWLQDIVDNLYKNGIRIFMATPSGARPKWLSDAYPEVLRVNSRRVKQLFGGRHNHCFTSPIYREKIKKINQQIGERFAHHPAVMGWHISNELGGECHCPFCQEAFRQWLKNRYGTIENLNKCWYTTFWSHVYGSFDQIESPSAIGESELHGLNLDWKRFVTDQTLDFLREEVSALRTFNDDIPVTTNFMYYFNGLNYFAFKDDLDFISWDTYPVWHRREDHKVAMENAMWHDLMRSINQSPFVLMESTPSYTNWQGVTKPKKPGMHELSSLQAIAHGSDSVLYFQWRQSRGASEKFHGAVVQHDGRSDTRTFKEVKALGHVFEDLSEIQGTTTQSSVAIVYDWENKWAMEDSQGPRNKGMFYIESAQKHYYALKSLGLDVDFIDMSYEVDDYDVLIMPKLYMFRNGFEDKIRNFVAAGKKVVMTCWSGVVDENDQCFLGDVPHNLTDVFGLRREEFIGLHEDEFNRVEDGFKCNTFCEIIKTSTANILYSYQEDYYAKTPAVTVNDYEDGKAYYIACDLEQDFYDCFYEKILSDTEGLYPLGMKLPSFVHTSTRQDDKHQWLFLQNYGKETAKLLEVNSNLQLIYSGNNDTIHRTDEIKPYQTLIYKKEI